MKKEFKEGEEELLEEAEVLMKYDIHKKNLENFVSILKYFFLTKQSYKDVLNAIYPKFGYRINWEFDDFLGLNYERRVWFELPEKQDPLNDANYLTYKTLIDKSYKTRSSFISQDKSLTLILLDYNTFLSGSFIYDKNKYKLFKFLFSNKILTEKQVTDITSSKTSKKKSYLCISRNPIDYLFCATGQSFTSCESLKSQTSAYWMGLGALAVDPNRCIIFITDSNPVTYKIKGLDFHHYRYSQRTWGIWVNSSKTKEGCIALIRHYPRNYVEIGNIIKKAGLKCVDWREDDCYDIESVHTFRLPQMIDYGGKKRAVFIYLDNMGLKVDSNSRSPDLLKYDVKYHSHSYQYIGAIISFDTNVMLEEVETNKDLTLYKRRCRNCKGIIEIQNSEYCEPCIKKLFIPCGICNTTMHQDDSRSVIPIGRICLDCASNKIINCSWCSRNFLKGGKDTRPILYIEYGPVENIISSFTICNDCLIKEKKVGRSSTCEKCNKLFYDSTSAQKYSKAKLCYDCLIIETTSKIKVEAKEKIKKVKTITARNSISTITTTNRNDW